MAKVKLYRECRKGTICLQFCNRAGETARHYLPFSVEERFWDRSSCRVVGCPNKDSINVSLQAVLVRAQDELLRMVMSGPTKHLSSAEVRDRVCDILFNNDVEGAALFVSVFNEYVNSLSHGGTRANYQACLSACRMFDSDIDLRRFEDLDVAWLRRFHAFHLSRGITSNSIVMYMRCIRAVFNYAIDAGTTSAYPFRNFKIRKVETFKRNLSVDELRLLFSFPVPEDAFTRRQYFERKYIDTCLISFLLCGINMKDLLTLTWENLRDGRIEYRRAKTGRLYSIKVEPEAMEVIERYRVDGCPYLWGLGHRFSDYRAFVRKTNNALNDVCRSIGIRSSTTYSMRHSVASLMSELDVPNDVISAVLGHSMGNPTTAIYINFNQKKVDEANRLLIDYVLHGRKVPWDERVRS